MAKTSSGWESTTRRQHRYPQSFVNEMGVNTPPPQEKRQFEDVLANLKQLVLVRELLFPGRFYKAPGGSGLL